MEIRVTNETKGQETDSERERGHSTSLAYELSTDTSSRRSRDIWSGELPTHSSRSHRRLHSKHLSMELELVGQSPCLVGRRHLRHPSKASEPHDTHSGPSREHRITEGTEQSPGAESPSGRRHIAPTGRRWSSESRFIDSARRSI